MRICTLHKWINNRSRRCKHRPCWHQANCLTAGRPAAYTVVMADLEGRLFDVLSPQHVLVGDAIGDDYTHDEALTGQPVRPLAVVRPGSTDDVVSVLRIC